MIMSNSTYNQLTANLELLKLTQMKLHLDEIRDFVTTNGLSFTEGLLKLSNYEVDFKEQNASRSMIKAAAFPFVKEDRKSTRLNSSHDRQSRMPSSA